MHQPSARTEPCAGDSNILIESTPLYPTSMSYSRNTDISWPTNTFRINTGQFMYFLSNCWISSGINSNSRAYLPGEEGKTRTLGSKTWKGRRLAFVVTDCVWFCYHPNAVEFYFLQKHLRIRLSAETLVYKTFWRNTSCLIYELPEAASNLGTRTNNIS